MYRLQILTPEQIFFDGQVISTLAPGDKGYLGILTDHTPLIASLRAGLFIYTDTHNVKHYYKVERGFLEVNHNEVAVLVEGIYPTQPVDILSGLN